MSGERNSHILLGSQLQTQSSNWAPEPLQGVWQRQGAPECLPASQLQQQRPQPLFRVCLLLPCCEAPPCLQVSYVKWES